MYLGLDYLLTLFKLRTNRHSRLRYIEISGHLLNNRSHRPILLYSLHRLHRQTLGHDMRQFGERHHFHNRDHPPRQIPSWSHKQQCSVLGLHRCNLGVQFLLLSNQRPPFLDSARRDLRYPYAVQRCLDRNHDFFCIQHHDWTSHSHRAREDRLEILRRVCCL